MKLGFPNISFQDLYEPQGLQKVENAFVGFLERHYPEFLPLYKNRYSLENENHSNAQAISNFLTSFAPIVEQFIAALFLCEESSYKHIALAQQYKNMNKFKKNFIQRKVAKLKEWPQLQEHATFKELEGLLEVKGLNDLELSQRLQQKIDEGLEQQVLLFCKHKMQQSNTSMLFQLSESLDFCNLVKTELSDNLRYIDESKLEHRDGFNLTDNSITNNQLSYNAIKSHAAYCLYCHNRGKDSCSTGFLDSPKASDTSQYKKNALGINLEGCPLGEKISEMNYLANEGFFIGALAAAIVDNPMIAATGHRICNDCMKACIYQKQEPVDIPRVETGVLNEVLLLNYGFEIYSFLTRWNPLNYRPTPTLETSNAPTILVAGLGPAGFTLAHYLLNTGCNVIAIDGLKIEPLPSTISGISESGARTNFQPIKHIEQLYDSLSTRPAYGFGGVAEYGITVRWNKNYLKIIRLLLERRKNFRMYGSVRLGSNFTLEQAKNIGISHISLCFGAGSPNILNIPNILAKGVRTASDFLMNLQLSGAARKNSNSNLQLRMPIAIIGGGLTAIDTATEALEYYAVQVQKVLDKYNEMGDFLFNGMDEEEVAIAQEFISHAKLLNQNPKDKYNILRSMGGSTICYRKTLSECTAYKLNHEEVGKAFNEGIFFLENIKPLSIEVDANKNAIGVRHSDGLIEARSIFIATGTKPNTILSREVAGIELDGMYFAKDSNYQFENLKGKKTSVIMKNKNFNLSFFGDLHPQYAGNVVKAMASAKDGYKWVIESIKTNKGSINKKRQDNFSSIVEHLDSALLTQVIEVNTLAPKIVEIIVHSPYAAKNFKPGQFYRVQNFETTTKPIERNSNKDSKSGKKIQPVMEALALTGAVADAENGTLSLIVLEMGGSSDFCKYLKPKEYISMMGPTGAPTEIPTNKNVMLVGGGLGNAVLFSIAKACKENGCNILYFAGYKELKNMFKCSEIERCTDKVVWCCDKELPTSRRKKDLAFKGTVLEAIKWYGNTQVEQQNTKFSLTEIDHLIVIGSSQMMQAVAHNVHNELKHMFGKLKVAIGSINSPMQCMMKEICAQCLQKHVDPKTGKESYVYSCFNQDQSLKLVDFNHLNDRLSQNSVSEKICSNWLEG